MAKDPALMFYPSDFLTGTMFMSNEQVGIYIRLLCAQHQHGGIIDKISFNSMINNFDIIRSKFIETENGFFNERMMEELEKRSKKSCNLSANAKIRWEKHKQLKSKSNAIALQLDMPSEDINENEDIDINKKRKEKKIEIFENIFLTEKQIKQSKDYFVSEYENALKILSNYKFSSGKKYKSDYHALIGWVAEKIITQKNNGKQSDQKQSISDLKRAAAFMASGGKP